MSLGLYTLYAFTKTDFNKWYKCWFSQKTISINGTKGFRAQRVKRDQALSRHLINRDS